MSDRIVIDGEINLKIALDGEIDSVIKVGHEVVTESLTVTENGTYEAPDGVDGYAPVTVEIPAPTVQSKTVDALTTQQVIEPDDGYDYLSSVTVGGYFNALKYLTNIANLLKDKVIDADTIVLDFEGAIITNVYQAFYATSGVRKLVIKNIGYPDGAGVTCQEVFRKSKFKVIEFRDCVFRPANNLYPYLESDVEEIIGSIDMTYRTNSLSLPSGLREIRIVPSTIGSEFSIANCTELSADSLISIANGLNEESPNTYDIRRTNLLPTMQSITGNVVDSMFIADDNGNMTLEQFILNVKGWTIRNT